jgi:hypothetical protein
LPPPSYPKPVHTKIADAFWLPTPHLQAAACPRVGGY